VADYIYNRTAGFLPDIVVNFIIHPLYIGWIWIKVSSVSIKKILFFYVIKMTDKNELKELKDAVLKDEPNDFSKDSKIGKTDIRQRHREVRGTTEDNRKLRKITPSSNSSGTPPKSRILDLLIANKGQSFSKAKISEGAKVFKTAFFQAEAGQSLL